MKLKKAILIFAVMLSVLVLTGTGYAMASPPVEEWNRTYEMSNITSVESFQQTADSGYILTTYYYTRGNSYFFFDHIYMLKIDSTGSEQWNRTFSETFSGNRIISVLETSDGGYLIAGSISTCNNWNCTDDIWLVKMNTQGQEQWNLTLEGIDNEEVEFVQQTADGGYILIGNTNSYDVGTFEIWFVKVDSNGNMQWNKTFGGIGQDKAYSVNQVPGGYIIAGIKSDNFGDSDFWLVKTDTKGEELWKKTFPGFIWHESADSIQQTRDGGYIIAGGHIIAGIAPYDYDFLLVKIDSNGKEQWYRTFGGRKTEINPSVRQSPDGGYILGGETSSFDDGNYWLIQTDEDGNVQWDRRFKGTGLDSFQQTPDGGYIIKGSLNDPSIIKTDSNGNEQWDIRMEWDELDSILQTGNNGYILAGTKDSKLLLVKLIAERPPPTAQFTFDPGYPGANQTITFDASASHDPYGNITYYQWDMGDGSHVNTTQRTVTHSYDEGGNYNVGLTVTGSNDDMSSITREIIVQRSAPPIMRWDKTFGLQGDDIVHSLAHTSDGGYILAGSLSYDIGEPWHSDASSDARLVKTDANGNMQWQRTIGGIGGNGFDKAYSVIQTSDGGYILAGSSRFLMYDDFNINVNVNVRLVKTDADGIEQWNRTFGGEDIKEVTLFRQASDGGYIIAGRKESYGAGSDDFWLLKTDAQGTEQWNRTFGGDSSDWLYSFQQTFDGGYILCGDTHSFGNGSSDFWLLKTDNNGIELWNRTFGGDSSDWLYSFQQTFDGGFILGGDTRSFGTGSSDFLLVKTDSNGSEQWYRTFGGANNDRGYSVQQTFDGGYILAGMTESSSANHFDLLMLKIDSNGIEQWNRTIVGPNEDTRLYSILQSPDSGYIIAGKTVSSGTGSIRDDSYDMWLVSTDPDGSVQWEMTFGRTTFGGITHDMARYVLLAPDGGMVVAGDKDSWSDQGIDFWLMKLGGNPAESEGGDAPTDGEPVPTPDMPGFGAAVAVMGLLVWVCLAGRRL
jgi:PGF-CTERM protein